VLHLRLAVDGLGIEKNAVAPSESPNPQSATRNPQSVALRMRLIGANPTSQIIGLEELSGETNYLIGSDPRRWHTHIPTYAKVRYRSVYPHIDLVFYGQQRQLEYDFALAPGADPQAIKLAFTRAAKLPIHYPRHLN